MVTTSGDSATPVPFDSEPLPPGVYHQLVKFSPPALSAWEWPTIDIVGEQSGPRIAVWAGMHVNELSSVEAAFRLADLLDPSAVSGRVSIMPILNLPALERRTALECPIDGKNINFSFPGSLDGTFSEVLAYALINEWAHDAICTFDLHGGDIHEDVAQYTMIQLTGDAKFDADLRFAADGFGATKRIEFLPEYLEKSPGEAVHRFQSSQEHLSSPPMGSITARSTQRKLALMSEAGCNARIAETDIAFHMQGVLGVAARLGVVNPSGIDVAEAVTPRDIVSRVQNVHATVRGWGTPLTKPGDRVKRGDPLVEVRDYKSEDVSHILSPHDGLVFWTDHHPALEPGQRIAGIGVE